MSVIEALILGIIQGLTEFLPVSSSGHLELGSYFLGVQSEDNLLFSILVHGATALSTIVVFRKDILEIIQGLFKFQWNDETSFAAKILLSMIPVGLVGVLFEDQIEALFGGKILLVGAMLLVTAALLAFTYFSQKHEGSVTFKSALIIGLAQAIAILPGVSRSGSTISTALLLGVNKEKAARFSFLMVLPPIIGAMLLKTKDLIEAPELATGLPVTSLVVGFIAAFVAGLLACNWMISIVKKGKLIYFAVYCGVVGLGAVIGGLLI
ncbi:MULTISPECIES: undecaprenyl-diphosphate phosphatase [Reichenbachiella]|uniref:Undecaprenyl-diphosphatase n=1 Tax=Reichenbachiella agariperforans TaxID=156994 RepID=A0A1M6N5Q7_REIAG|nr:MULTISPECIES: undecaprenyl-diphosphate phosphatase [Reichenbachiella]MBU2915738.1 undecaprenyl-diphosphate phosphatase [Reichenbachiella agariperforans]RJE71995.1 UDP-diphosphatase [Reichenbachiella sp. MSK19-1]SHJ91001.1 undecaprenyl-diphosphatase [Reichenbachiella agariperforans]